MAKQKNRAARKKQRERAVRAEERGLPAVRPERNDPSRFLAQPKPSRRVGEDGHGSGSPAVFKVALGAIIALVLVFLLSELRKG